MKKMEASLHCWWGCKLIQPLWKMVWRCFKNHENNFTFLRHNVEQKDHWCGVGTPGSSFQPCHLILVKTQTPPDFICFIWKWEDHLRGQTCLSYYHVKRHSFKKKKKVPCENLEGTMRTVVPGHLVCWGDSGRALSDASHTWCTAKSLQRMSSEWHGQSRRGTQAFYLSLTPFNPAEGDFGHRQQMCWTWAQQGSKTFSTSQSQAGNAIGFTFCSLYEGSL